MKIVFDDLTEFAEVRLRCEKTRQKSMCKYCPFYNRCQIDDDENLHTMCCDILSMQNTPTDLQEFPTADVVEIKHGKWHLLDECSNEGVYCSICHKKVYRKDYANQKVKSNYCPNCGAKMDGGIVKL